MSEHGPACAPDRGPGRAEEYQRITRGCAAIRAALPQLAWDLAVVEVTAAAAAARGGASPAELSTVCGRFHDLQACERLLSEAVSGLAGDVASAQGATLRS